MLEGDEYDTESIAALSKKKDSPCPSSGHSKHFVTQYSQIMFTANPIVGSFLNGFPGELYFSMEAILNHQKNKIRNMS